MIKSPLRYPGGKSRAIKFLKNFIPGFTEYREPMIGGGSLLINILQDFPNVSCKASDINFDLYCFWNLLNTEPQLLINEIQQVYNSSKKGRELFSEILARRESDLSELQRAIDFFILNRITFSGVADSGGFSNESFNKRFTQSSIDRLLKTSGILFNVEFSHNDYRELIMQNGENVFIFLDPPYYSVSKSRLYGKKGKLHTDFDHEKFYQTVSNCKHKWLITYDNSKFIRDLFADYYQVEWELQYGMNNYRQPNAAKGKELLIANYDLHKMK